MVSEAKLTNSNILCKMTSTSSSSNDILIPILHQSSPDFTTIYHVTTIKITSDNYLVCLLFLKWKNFYVIAQIQIHYSLSALNQCYSQSGLHKMAPTWSNHPWCIYHLFLKTFFACSKVRASPIVTVSLFLTDKMLLFTLQPVL